MKTLDFLYSTITNILEGFFFGWILHLFKFDRMLCTVVQPYSKTVLTTDHYYVFCIAFYLLLNLLISVIEDLRRDL